MNILELEQKIAELTAQINETLDKAFLELLQSYLSLLGEMYGTLSNGGVLTWTSLNAYNRLNKYIARFAKISNDKYKDILRDIDKIRQKAYIQQRLFDEYDLYEQTGEDDGFDIPSEEVIREMVDNPIDKMKLPKVLQKHRDELVNDIQTSIISGTVKGSGFEEVAQDIKKKTGFSSEKARLVARTEIGRARSTAEVEMDEKIKKTGVKFNKYWLATLDTRTRHSHRALDGQKADGDGYFHSHGLKAKAPRMFGSAREDINCRCSTIRTLPSKRSGRDYNDRDYKAKLKKRKEELEKKGLKPSEAEVRANREIRPPNKVDDFMTYDEWFNKQFRDKPLEKTKENVYNDSKDKDFIKLSPNFVNSHDKLYTYAKKIKPIKGYTDITCHADKYGFIYTDISGNETRISVEQFYNDVVKSKLVKKGNNIRLIACSAGADDGVTAQHFANYMGVEVLAPTTDVLVYPDGDLKLENNGEWKIFKPDRSG